MPVVAETPPGGFIADHTEAATILEWTAPDDDQVHAVTIAAAWITTANPGLSITPAYTRIDGAQASGTAINPASTGSSSATYLVAPGGTITFAQNAAASSAGTTFFVKFIAA